MNKWVGRVCNPSREYGVSSWNQPTGHRQVQNWGQYPSSWWRGFPQRGRPIISLQPEWVNSHSPSVCCKDLATFLLKIHYVSQKPSHFRKESDKGFNWVTKYRHLLPLNIQGIFRGRICSDHPSHLCCQLAASRGVCWEPPSHPAGPHLGLLLGDPCWERTAWKGLHSPARKREKSPAFCCKAEKAFHC